MKHGKGVTNGYRFGPAAYLTDHSEIPQDTLDRLHGLDLLFLDALRHRPHPTHSTVAQSLETVAVLKPKRAFFTHISHDLPHAETEASLPENVMAGDEHNAKGYFEPWKVAILNDGLLRASGAAWDDVFGD